MSVALPLAARRASRNAVADGAAAELAAGLLSPAAHVAAKYLYDGLGSQLFELITLLPEYYLTRIESALLERHARAVADAVGHRCTLVDLGAGSCVKARLLLPALRAERYLAVDVATDFVERALAALRIDFPGLQAYSLSADLAQSLEPSDFPDGRRLFFFSGSSIGNFEPDAAETLVRRLRRLCRDGDALLIGVDLIKELPILDAAYNDALGITAAFNRNVLNHVNAVLGSDFDTRNWRHRAFYNCACSRVEMHLLAEAHIDVAWPGGSRSFLPGEGIHTESSYKYRLDDFRSLLGRGGFGTVRHWTDEDGWFAVCLARP